MKQTIIESSVVNTHCTGRYQTVFLNFRYLGLKKIGEFISLQKASELMKQYRFLAISFDQLPVFKVNDTLDMLMEGSVLPLNKMF